MKVDNNELAQKCAQYLIETFRTAKQGWDIYGFEYYLKSYKETLNQSCFPGNTVDDFLIGENHLMVTYCFFPLYFIIVFALLVT